MAEVAGVMAAVAGVTAAECMADLAADFTVGSMAGSTITGFTMGTSAMAAASAQPSWAESL